MRYHGLMRQRVEWLTAALVVLVGFTAMAAAAQAEDTVESQLAEILARHEGGATEPKDYDIPEEAANRFLREQQLAELPAGVESPWVRFEESLAIVGATVDLDQVKGSLPEGGVLQLLSGKVPVELTARVVGEAGIGKLVLEKVLLSGVELPVTLVEAMAGDAGEIPFLPGFRLGQAFPLPFGMKTIRCQAGRLTLRQGATSSK